MAGQELNLRPSGYEPDIIENLAVFAHNLFDLNQ